MLKLSKKKKVRPEPMFNRFSPKKMVIFAVIFGVLGSIIILKGLAAGPFASVEPENSSLTSGATTGSDSAASGGKYVQFGTAATTGACGRTTTVPTTYDHIIWITFENQSYQHVIGNTATQPYINQLANTCGLATQFYPERHPSLPNYIAMTSGSTQGITGDSTGSLSVDNIYNEVQLSGKQWRQYSFGMPSSCYKSDYPSSSNAVYTAHHEAVIYYTDVSTNCPKWDIPVSPGVVDDVNDVNTSQLAQDISNNTLPALAVIGPSDDGGNSTLGGEVDPKLGDPFLKRWVNKITNSTTYSAGRTAIFITWDEGDDFSATTNLNNIATIVVAPSTPNGTKSATTFNHYAMLRTTEEMLGLKTLIGNAATAPSMRSAFHI